MYSDHISLLGYNHPSMLDIWKDDQNIRTLVNRPALGFYPNVEWPDMLKRVLLSVAPPGLNQVMARLITAETEVVAQRWVSGLAIVRC